jgi:hypothetical protein
MHAIYPTTLGRLLSRQVVLRLYYGSIEALLRLYYGSIKDIEAL